MKTLTILLSSYLISIISPVQTGITDADLTKLKQEDILTDAQLDNFKMEGHWIGPTWWANRMADWTVNGQKTKEIHCHPNRALSTMRAARAVHIAGDQHLSTLVQHGIENHDDRRKVIGLLANITVTNASQPIVSVYTSDGKLSWSQPMITNKFTIPAYQEGQHKIVITENGKSHHFTAIPAEADEELPLTKIKLQ